MLRSLLLSFAIVALSVSSSQGQATGNNVTVGSTSHLYVYMVNQEPVFKVYPCTRDQLANAPTKSRLRRFLQSSDDESGDTDDSDAASDKSSCPNDSRLMVVEFRRIAELDSQGSKQGGTTVELRDQSYTLDSSDNTKIVIESSFRASPSCTLFQAYNGKTNVTITAQVLPAGTSTSMGTLSQDSFKWSVDITNWPFCTGTTYLDLIVALKQRGSGKDTARTEDHNGDGKKDSTSSTSVGGTSRIIFPLVATLDGNNIAVNVSSEISSGQVALTHFQLPVTYNNGTHQVYANTIFYDPAYGYISTGLSAGAIAGITIGCVVAVALVVAVVIVVHRRKHPVARKRSFLGWF